MERDEQLDDLRRLYPALTDEELREARENLDRYLELTVRLYERLLADPEAYRRFQDLLKEQRANERGSDAPRSHDSDQRARVAA